MLDYLQWTVIGVLLIWNVLDTIWTKIDLRSLYRRSEDVGMMKVDIKYIKNDVQYIKEKLDK